MEAYQEELTARMRGQAFRVFCNNTREARMMVAPHWHDACEVLLIRRGWGRQRINTETLSIHPGDAVLLCPGDIHATEALAPDGMDIDVLQFYADVPTGDRKIWQELKSAVIRTESAAVQELLLAFSRYAGGDELSSRLMMTGLAQILLSCFLRSAQAQQHPLRSETMEQICAHLTGAPDLKLETTAAHFGYCAEHLSRRFHAEMGLSYRAYCDQLRMKRATVLLHEEGESLSSVAERLGYSDTSSFIRAFRRLLGITPSAYRRLCLPVGRQAEMMMK